MDSPPGGMLIIGPFGDFGDGRATEDYYGTRTVEEIVEELGDGDGVPFEVDPVEYMLVFAKTTSGGYLILWFPPPGW